jgi:hypothetical protein
VHIDETRSEHKAVELNDLGACWRFDGAPRPNRSNPVPDDSDVGRSGRRSTSVDEEGVSQQQVHLCSNQVDSDDTKLASAHSYC